MYFRNRVVPGDRLIPVSIFSFDHNLLITYSFHTGSIIRSSFRPSIIIIPVFYLIICTLIHQVSGIILNNQLLNFTTLSGIRQTVHICRSRSVKSERFYLQATIYIIDEHRLALIIGRCLRNNMHRKASRLGRIYSLTLTILTIPVILILRNLLVVKLYEQILRQHISLTVLLIQRNTVHIAACIAGKGSHFVCVHIIGLHNN